jgi:hypothetical protein
VDVLVVVVVVVVEGDFDLVAGRMRFVEGRACTKPWPIIDPNNPQVKERERERERIQFPNSGFSWLSCRYRSKL